MSNEAESRKKRIERKFVSYERSIRALDAYLKEDSPDAVIADLRLKSITKLYNEYIHNHEELISIQNDHPHVAAFERVETEYFRLAGQVTKLKSNTTSAFTLANSTSLNNTSTFNERTTVAKLAPITVPSFDGNSKNWVSWKASFQALIHERPGMAGSVKLSQLQEAVRGLAKIVIKGFKPTDENYPLAWAALCKAYDQRRVIVNEHFDALLKLSPAPKPTAETTAELMYTVRQHVSMLKAMDINLCDEFVARILERCLPKYILSRWVDRQSSNEPSKLEELYDFIQDSVFRQRELDELPSLNPPTKRAANGNLVHPLKLQKTSTHSLVTTSTSSSNACLQCGQPHRLYQCEKFEQSTMKEKWEFVKKHKLCRNCLYVHPLPCPSEKRCKKCKRDHHTFLHTDKTQKSQPTNEAKSSGAEKK